MASVAEKSQSNPAVGGSWLPAERELATRLRPTHTIREIAIKLKENGFDRSPKAVEKFFSRIGLTQNTAKVEAGILPNQEESDEDVAYQQGPVKTTWGEPMLVGDKYVEFGLNTSVVPVVFLPDIHAPFQDDRAIELSCKIIEYIKPTAIVYLGDNVDWHQISNFDKDPRRIIELQNEIDAFHQVDRSIMSAAGKGVPRYYILGNHEDRLRRYQSGHPEISEIRGMQFDSMLGLGPSFNPIPNLQLIDGEINWRNGRFVAKHGKIVRKWSGYSAKAELDAENTSGISGHTHRASVYSMTTRARSISWYESGCLCSLEPSYMRNPNWQHAISIGHFNGDKTTDFFHIDLILLSKYQAIAGGKYFTVKNATHYVT